MTRPPQPSGQGDRDGRYGLWTTDQSHYREHQVTSATVPDLLWIQEDWRQVAELVAPGRVNLIGEHLDYNGGVSLPFAIARGIRFTLERWCGPSPAGPQSFLLFVTQKQHDQLTGLALCAEAHLCTEAWRPLPAGADPYLRGCAELAASLWSPAAQEHPRGLWRIVCDNDLPQGAGLSSSAAYCLGLLTCLSVIHGKNFSHSLTAAVMAQHVEHRFAGTPCGLMDQFAILASPPHCYLELDFSGAPTESPGTDLLPPLTGVPQVYAHRFAEGLWDHYSLLLFHTGRKHQLSDGSYATRRQECEEALHSLLSEPGVAGFGRSGVRPETLGAWLRSSPDWDQLEFTAPRSSLAEALTSRIQIEALRSRARFVFGEIGRARLALSALDTGNIKLLDELLRAGHKGLHEDYAVSCSEVETAVHLIRQAAEEMASQAPMSTTPAVLGPRMMGGGWGGSLIMLIDKARRGALLDRLGIQAERYASLTGCKPELIETSPAPGLAYTYPKAFGA